MSRVDDGMAKVGGSRLLDEKGDLLIKVRWKGLLVEKASSSVIFTSKARTPAAGDSAQVDLGCIYICGGGKVFCQLLIIKVKQNL